MQQDAASIDGQGGAAGPASSSTTSSAGPLESGAPMEGVPPTNPPAGCTASGPHPPNDFAAYGSTKYRHPLHAPLSIEAAAEAERQPRIALDDLSRPCVQDLTQHLGRDAIGERIIVSGQVLDTEGRPLPHALVEIWQANAAGRYRHAKDEHRAPLDPGFCGAGRMLTDGEGRYRFQSIRPGSYPWRNHENAWRPAHIHFSIVGPSFASRLVTQMYFPGDPLLAHDPIFASIREENVRERLIARFDLGLTEPEWALGYRFDLVLRGATATPTQAEPRKQNR